MAHQTFPSDLPIPTDDGACTHLKNLPIPPHISLSPCTTPSNPINLSRLPGLTLLFVYPRTGAPNETVPPSWNAIPGARGCTPELCSVRDEIRTLRELGVGNVFGVSTQGSAYQAEVHGRLGLGYDLLSDEGLEFARGMGVPVFKWEGKEVMRRVTLAVEGGRVVRVWYPVFPPDAAAGEVIEWLRAGRGGDDFR